MKFTKFEKLSLKNHSKLNERWVQERIIEDPSILNLGEVIVKDQERIQPRAGRLDLLLQDAESTQRYTVEIQLGAVDESHIIRTIEYWDIERKRYPQYEHTAVIIAEDITSRFLNVISLFNGTIPLIAIQMSALTNGEEVGLLFTTVLDQMRLGLVDEDEETYETTDRAYWESRGTKKTVAMADEILELARQFEPSLKLKYNKFYIGFMIDGRAKNFMLMRAQKNVFRIDPRLNKSQENTEKFEQSGLDVMDFDNRRGRYRIRLKHGEIEKHKSVLVEIIKESLENSR